MKKLEQIEDYLIDKVIDIIFWVIGLIPPNKIAQFALWVTEENKK